MDWCPPTCLREAVSRVRPESRVVQRVGIPGVVNRTTPVTVS